MVRKKNAMRRNKEAATAVSPPCYLPCYQAAGKGLKKNTKRVPRVFEAHDAPDCALFHTFVNLFSAVARAPSDPVNFNFCAVAFSYSLTPLFTVN